MERMYARDNYCKLYVQRMRVLCGGTSGVWSPNEFQNFSMVRKLLSRQIAQVNMNPDGTRKSVLVWTVSHAWKASDASIGVLCGT